MVHFHTGEFISSIRRIQKIGCVLPDPQPGGGRVFAPQV
jgi:hypothetical protein